MIKTIDANNDAGAGDGDGDGDGDGGDVDIDRDDGYDVDDMMIITSEGR